MEYQLKAKGLFCNFYNIDDKRYAQALLCAAEQSVKNIRSAFCLKSTVKDIVIEVSQSVEQFCQITKSCQADKDKNHAFDCTKKTIYLLSPSAHHPFDQKNESKMLTHYIAHILFEHCLGEKQPYWLFEGIAMYCAGQIDKNLIDIKKIPCLDDISGEKNGCNTQDANAHYAGVFVCYFLFSFGVKKFIDAYRGKVDVGKIIHQGFEQEAVTDYISLL